MSTAMEVSQEEAGDGSKSRRGKALTVEQIQTDVITKVSMLTSVCRMLLCVMLPGNDLISLEKL